MSFRRLSRPYINTILMALLDNESFLLFTMLFIIHDGQLENEGNLGGLLR